MIHSVFVLCSTILVDTYYFIYIELSSIIFHSIYPPKLRSIRYKDIGKSTSDTCSGHNLEKTIRLFSPPDPYLIIKVHDRTKTPTEMSKSRVETNEMKDPKTLCLLIKEPI